MAEGWGSALGPWGCLFSLSLSLTHTRTLHATPHPPPSLPCSEPGYYEDGAFGIRIENVLVVEKARPACSFGGDVWCGLQPLTCVPIGTAAVELAQMSVKEVRWLNAYNEQCRQTLEPLLQGEEDREGLQWLLRETAPLPMPQ